MIVISALGYLNENGYGSHAIQHDWPAAVCPKNALRWRMISTHPFERFGRLDLLSKYAMAAVEMLALQPNAEKDSDTALLLTSARGCLGADLEFLATMQATPSPALFTYTLPSIALGEIAIRYRISGPNLCLLDQCEPGPLAICEAFRLLTLGEAKRCLAITADALDNDQIGSLKPFWPDESRHECYAQAWLLESLSEAAAAGRKPLATIERRKANDADDDFSHPTAKEILSFLLDEPNIAKHIDCALSNAPGHILRLRRLNENS